MARLPRHIGFIPDGNRRWAERRGLPRRAGYAAGVQPGIELLRLAVELGIQEVSAYGFTKENVRRPRDQVAAFQDACVEFAMAALAEGAALLVVGDSASPVFPEALLPFAENRALGRLPFNLLVNYSWQWACGRPSARRPPVRRRQTFADALGSAQVSRVDLVVRWGGRQRLSGFLPLQCAYADFYALDTLWPDMRAESIDEVLEWYAVQDVTLGG